MKIIVTAFFVIQSLNFGTSSAAKPLVINTWNFLDAGQKGKLNRKMSLKDS